LEFCKTIIRLNVVPLKTNIEIGSKTTTYFTESEMLQDIEYKIEDLKGAELEILNRKNEKTT
jgi:hypothetical protein|tara:strand:+ start:555 stop:740 length:186 start_codon:yes stop_codon:yes gene_type:complete